MPRFASVFVGALLSATLSVNAQKMYWTDLGTSRIQRADLDGTNIENLVVDGATLPRGIALDIRSGKMYWTEPDQGGNAIRRANLDGSDVEDVISAGLGGPAEIALDIEAGKIYWTAGGGNKIQRANLDGSDIEDLVTIYWTDAINLTIRRADVDGSNVEILVKIGLDSPGGIALDLRGNVPAVGSIVMAVMVALLLGAGAFVLARRQRTARHLDMA